MTTEAHPASRAAERRRKAAERAREHRARTAASAAVDAAIVDALGHALRTSRVDAPSMRPFLAAFMAEAKAKVAQPGAVAERLGLTRPETTSPCDMRPNR